MFRSFLATVGGNVEDDKLQATIKGMINRAGLGNKKELDFNDFIQMVGKDISNLNKTKLNLKGASSSSRQSYLETARDTLETIYELGY